MQQFYFAQKAFIVHDGRLLLVRKSADDPNQAGKWEVPGGRMDFGEDVDPHIIREVKEEVGLTIKPGRPFFLWQWQLARKSATGEIAQMQIVAVARLCSPTTMEISEAGRVEGDFLDECRWVTFAEIKLYDLIPNMLPVVEAFLQEVALR